jgi:hypothetical protein
VEPSQESPDSGWRLVAQRANGLFPALQVTPLGDTSVAVVLVVAGGCPNGGPGTPTFTGFNVNGEVIEAVVTRKPIPSPGQCLVNSGIEFDVELDLRTVPASARTMILGGQACPTGDDRCAATTAPLPAQGLATPSG